MAILTNASFELCGIYRASKREKERVTSFDVITSCVVSSSVVLTREKASNE